jgi:hypothetical protein
MGRGGIWEATEGSEVKQGETRRGKERQGEVRRGKERSSRGGTAKGSVSNKETQTPPRPPTNK